MNKNPLTPQYYARQLRQTSTDAERWLWQRLRGRRLLGYKFRRQVPIGNYIADFLCNEHKIVVEIDGSQHQDQTDYDQRRTDFLVKRGYTVVRYWNNDILEQGEGVLVSLIRTLAEIERQLKHNKARNDLNHDDIEWRRGIC